MASFYENQLQARRKTGLLAFYFALAVVLIVLAVDVVLFFADRYVFVAQGVYGPAHEFSLAAFKGFFSWMGSKNGIIASVITLGVLLLGSAFKTLQLSKKGGDQVAIMAGGTWVDLNTTDARERQLLNVVEEMAIASGIKPPHVYLLREEAGINAFVAGLTPNETALAVTQGALETFTRDELQGVIGHEFSHILNSDMRINVRLIGLLAGILMIGQIGRVLMRTQSRRISTGSKKGGNPLPLIGFALYLIGSVGLFFGQLIKAALSRQREFLADASSVQFTRNPLGIGGALLKIRNASQQSYLRSARAEDISHMCFGTVMSHRFNALFATHPPLDERIQAIDPSLESKLETRQATDIKQKIQSGKERFGGPSAAENLSAGVSGFTETGLSEGFSRETSSWGNTVAADTTQDFTGHDPTLAHLVPQKLKASVGTLTEAQVHWAEKLHQRIPDRLLTYAHHPQQAPTLLYAMVLAAPQHDAIVNQALKALLTPEQLSQVLALRTTITAMPVALRLPLFDITMPTLQHLPADNKAMIMQTLRGVIGADKRYTLSECAYYMLAEKYLQPKAKDGRTINSMNKVQKQVVTVFAALAQAAKREKQDQQAQFDHAMRCLGIQNEESALQQPLSASALTDAMQILGRLSPLLKRSLVENAVDMVLADHLAHLTELELLRAFCEMLDCPMPPVVNDAVSA